MRGDSRTIGIIGAGCQACTNMLAHSELFSPIAINVFGISKVAVDSLINSFLGFSIKNSSIKEAAASYIVCTLTSSHNPIIKKEWIIAGSHINAVGADAPGKEELASSILKDTIVVIDDLKQASACGKINIPIQKSIYTIREVYGTLAELVTGKKKGRLDN